MGLTRRQQILIYLAVTLVLTGVMHYFLIKHIGTIKSIWALLLMWIPGLVAIACSNSFGYQGRDLGLKIPNSKFLAWGYAVPAIAAILILIISIAIGIGTFTIGGDSTFLIRRLLLAPTIGILLSTFAAVGEELGWRGFLHTHLKELDINNPYFVTGVIWAVWHWPLILWGDYATSKMPMFSLAMFTIMVISFSIFLGQLRQASKSVWPVALAHGVHNTWIQGIYPSFYVAGALDPFFGGESGLILAVLYLIFAIVLQRYPLLSDSKRERR